MLKTYAIRGATTIKLNTITEIKSASLELLNELLQKNSLDKCDLISLTTTTTQDITAAYPVKFMRDSNLCGDMPFFSCSEPNIDNALQFCIRVLLLVQLDNTNFKPQHIYLNNAKILRPDIN